MHFIYALKHAYSPKAQQLIREAKDFRAQGAKTSIASLQDSPLSMLIPTKLSASQASLFRFDCLDAAEHALLLRRLGGFAFFDAEAYKLSLPLLSVEPKGAFERIFVFRGVPYRACGGCVPGVVWDAVGLFQDAFVALDVQRNRQGAFELVGLQDAQLASLANWRSQQFLSFLRLVFPSSFRSVLL